MNNNCYPLVFAVVVTYNGKKWYDKCIGCLKSSSVPIVPVIIDNASSDGTQDYIRDNFPEAKLIESSHNLGFAKANNIGIRYAYDNGADYVLLLNQDAWIFPDTIALLLYTFKSHEDAGIVSPMHLNGEMDSLDFNFATNMSRDFVSDIFLCKLKSDYPLPYINAACWLISRKCIETVGGFDTNLYIHYGEDGDYCKRIIYHKFKLYLSTKAKACHDREFRRYKENEYRKNSIMSEDMGIKSELSNILCDVDIDNYIRACKKKLFVKLCKLNFHQYNKTKSEIALYTSIKKSRDVNKTEGLNWL